MANCCFTEIDIYSDNYQKELETLAENLCKWTEGEYDQKWLGNILIRSGVVTEEDIKEGRCPYRCRGSLVYSELYGSDQLHITTETAWVPMMSMWQAVCGKAGIKDANIVFSGEERGCGVLVTNNPDILSAPYEFDGYFDEKDNDMICFFDPYNADMHDGYVEEDNVTEKRLKEVFNLAKKEYPEIEHLEDLNKHMKSNGSYFVVHKYTKASLSSF